MANKLKTKKPLAKRLFTKAALHIVITAVVSFSLGVFLTISKYSKDFEPIEQALFKANDIEQELSEWELLELAIIKTESDFNFTARGANNSLGIFQITDIYVEECNRILDEPKYVLTDAFIPLRSLDMFDLIQNSKNPGKDFIKAINIHNPGGESIGYSQKVLSNMEYIRRYEYLRTLIKDRLSEKKDSE